MTISLFRLIAYDDCTYVDCIMHVLSLYLFRHLFNKPSVIRTNSSIRTQFLSLGTGLFGLVKVHCSKNEYAKYLNSYKYPGYHCRICSINLTHIAILQHCIKLILALHSYAAKVPECLYACTMSKKCHLGIGVLILVLHQDRCKFILHKTPFTCFSQSKCSIRRYRICYTVLQCTYHTP